MEKNESKKQFYQYGWFWVLIFVIICGIYNSSNTTNTANTSNSITSIEKNITSEPITNQQGNSSTITNEVQNDVQTTNSISEEETKQQDTTPSVETPTVTLGQKNALSKAKAYLNYTAFSYKGLIEQLEFEGYSNEEATYGADNCGANWNEQASKKAQAYLNYSSFSRQGLIEQLEFEGFTKEQAEYGVKAVGY